MIYVKLNVAENAKIIKNMIIGAITFILFYEKQNM